MSIYDEIVHRVNEGRLFLLMPLVGDPVRRIYVSETVRDMLDTPMDDIKRWGWCQHLRVDLDYFTLGMRLVVDFEAKREKTSQLARMEPARDELWMLRSRAYRPMIRVFGRFATRDTFVALTWSQQREKGGSASTQSRDDARGCRPEWNKLFPAHGPLKGDVLNDYVTNAVSA